MSSDVISKIQRLIALAGSDNENEARNAAVLACRLIREHKITIGPSHGIQGAVQVDFQDFFNTIFRNAQKVDIDAVHRRTERVRADTFHQDVDFERRMRAEEVRRRAGADFDRRMREEELRRAANAPPMRKRSEAGRKK